jgi:glutamate synthase domain-containing protein 3
MKILNANEFEDYRALNEAVREALPEEVQIDNCLGQRYIASAAKKGANVVINGVPGNALGAYLDGGRIEVFGNAQDATGDTMNDGEIIVHGSLGDAVGYGMRGGRILIERGCGYRAGIHMKAYQQKSPVLVVGGNAGSFLGEYQAGGTIIVLGLYDDAPKVGYGCATGMHGGEIFIRTNTVPDYIPKQISAEKATEDELSRITPIIKEFAQLFGKDANEILNSTFLRLSPNSNSPYSKIYTHN